MKHTVTNSEILKALVVDDSTTVRHLMDLTLSPLGIALDFAGTGEKAIYLAQANDYDIIFLDVVLPGIDGYRVCKHIKGDKNTKQTPVIMLTSRDSTFDKVRGMMAGTDIYLTKPLNRAELITALRKYLPEHSMTLAQAGVNAQAS